MSKSKTSKTAPPGDVTGAFPALLVGRPFHSNFEYVACSRFPGRPAARLRRAVRELPQPYWTCIALDVGPRTVGVVGLALT